MPPRPARARRGAGSARAGGIDVEVLVRADLETAWRLTQHPPQHARWDPRFSAIVPQTQLPRGGYRFRNERETP